MKNLRLSEDDLKAIQKRLSVGATVRTHSLDKGQREPKYKNEKMIADGRLFHSKREAARWSELKLLEHGGKISDLKHQVRFDLHVKGTLVCAYIADFTYTQNGVNVVEDSKGPKTKEYVIKRKLMKAVHGIEVHET